MQILSKSSSSLKLGHIDLLFLQLLIRTQFVKYEGRRVLEDLLADWVVRHARTRLVVPQLLYLLFDDSKVGSLSLGQGV